MNNLNFSQFYLGWRRRNGGTKRNNVYVSPDYLRPNIGPDTAISLSFSSFFLWAWETVLLHCPHSQLVHHWWVLTLTFLPAFLFLFVFNAFNFSLVSSDCAMILFFLSPSLSSESACDYLWTRRVPNMVALTHALFLFSPFQIGLRGKVSDFELWYCWLHLHCFWVSSSLFFFSTHDTANLVLFIIMLWSMSRYVFLKFCIHLLTVCIYVNSLHLFQGTREKLKTV